MAGGIENLQNNIKQFLESDSGYATATKIVLSVIALSGVIIVGAMAPNIFQIFGRSRRGSQYSPQQLRNSVYYLRRKKYIEIIKEGDDKITVKLTNKGKRRIKEFSIDDLTISKPKSWDKKWWVVIFDIPIKFNKAREALRDRLKKLGFYQLQKSVWIYPYPCEDEILFLANIFQIEPFIEIFTADELLHEDKIRKFFKLS